MTLGRSEAPFRRRATRIAIALFLIVPAACASATARRADAVSDRAPGPAGVVHVAWQVQVHEHKLFEPPAEECSTGALAGDLLVIGSRAGKILGIRATDGHVDWATAASGGIDSEALYAPEQGLVYLGADDGTFYAVDPRSGKVRWSHRAKGAIERAPALGGDTVYVSTASDRVLALEAATGRWRWQYERETPEGFTIHGYGGPRLRGSELLVGFADGYLVSLQAASGEVGWAKSLASTSDQFVDVDTTPLIAGASVYAASYSGGVYALDGADGGVRWRLGIEGAGPMSVIGDRLYFAVPRRGLHAVSLDGRILWRQGLAKAGDVTAPLSLGRYLIFSGTRAGLFIVDRRDGELLEIFDPGQGICAQATIDPTRNRVYVLSNGGALYALDLDP